MARPAGPTHWLLNGAAGWRTASASGVAVGRAGITLATAPGGPLALDDPAGTLGGLAPPRYEATGPDGVRYRLDPDAPAVLREDPRTEVEVALPGIGGVGAQPRQLAAPAAIAVAGAGAARTLYVADRGNRRVQAFGLGGLELRHVWDGLDAADVAAGPASPAGVLVLDAAGGRVLRHRPGVDALAPVVEDPSAAGRWTRLAVDRDGRCYLLDPAVPRLQVFDRAGRLVGEVYDAGEVRDRFDPAPTRRGGAQPSYAASGFWESTPLDSAIHRCEWHRIVIHLAALPEGTHVTVRTRTAAGWDDAGTAAGQPRAPDGTTAPEPLDCLVRSGPDRRLAVQVELRGDGDTTPQVRAIRVHYPRMSYLEHLPAVFSSDEAGRGFLGRFLSLFQTEWDDIEQRIRDIAAYFDPVAVPDGPALDWLMGWLALPVEGTWDADARRRLLAAGPALLRRRGTPDGVATIVRVYLEHLVSAALPQDGFPRIVEGFRERGWLTLGGRQAVLGGQAPLWSQAVAGRLQLGVYATEGTARLVSVGDPARDVFHRYAHRFRVFVPSAWVRTAADERMVRRAVDAERPAPTAYDLCLVEPRLRVGVQSTVGLDTIVGGWPVARLACSHLDAPPSRPPRSRLGYDTVLAPSPDVPPRVRVGATTIGGGSVR